MIKMPEQPKEWSQKRGYSLIEDFDILLGDMCVIWGFCNGLTGWELAHAGGTITAESFTHAVLDAEDLPSHEAEAWHPKIMEKFVERYGAQVSAEGFTPPR